MSESERVCEVRVCERVREKEGERERLFGIGEDREEGGKEKDKGRGGS